jgi:hypothetical protein
VAVVTLVHIAFGGILVASTLALFCALAGLVQSTRYRGEVAEAPPALGVRVYVDPRTVDDLIAEMEPDFRHITPDYFQRLSALYSIPEET